MQLQATQDKLLKGFTVSAKERAEIGKRRIYQSELEALQLSSSTGGMSLEEEIMEHPAAIALKMKPEQLTQTISRLEKIFILDGAED